MEGQWVNDGVVKNWQKVVDYMSLNIPMCIIHVRNIEKRMRRRIYKLNILGRSRKIKRESSLIPISTSKSISRLCACISVALGLVILIKKNKKRIEDENESMKITILFKEFDVRAMSPYSSRDSYVWRKIYKLWLDMMSDSEMKLYTQ